MDGYQIESFVFESLPECPHVTALVYIPDGPAGEEARRARHLRPLVRGKGVPQLQE